MADNTLGHAYIDILPSMKGFGKALSSSLGPAADIAVGSIAACTAAVTTFAGASVNAGKAFDSSMSQVAATMGYSVEELNTVGSDAQKTLEELSNFALEMGSTTAFSASEAANALNYMALAGYDAETSMEMLPTVLNLAAAGGINLASASDMVTDAQSALGLSLNETSIMVDQMAAAAANSNTSVDQLGEAFLTIGANARSLSGGTKELSTALGLLADNGIKGSEGGTHLRNILLSMNPTTKAASEAWESLGVKAYDAQGNLRPLEDIFSELSVAMADMTDQERNATLSQMFNKTDLAAVNALLGTEKERWNELGGAIEWSRGAAEDMAEVQLDNLEGDITLFKSALEGFQITVSNGVTPALREFVQFGADGLSRLTEAYNNGGLEAAMSELGTIISEGLDTIITALPDAIDAGAELLGAVGQGIIDNLPQIVDAALQITFKLVEYLISAAPKLIESAIVLISELSQGLAEQLPTLIPTMVNAVITMVMALLDNIDMLIDSAIVLITALADGLLNALPILIEKAPEIVEKLVRAIIDNLPKILECAGQLILALATGLIENLPSLYEQVPAIVACIVVGLVECIGDIVEVGAQFVEGLWNGINGKVDWIIEKVKGFGNEVLQGMKDFFAIGSPSKLLRDEVGQWIPAGIGVGIEANADSVLNAMDDVANQTLDAGINLTDEIANGSYSVAGGTVVQNSNNNELLSLLAQYLPIIASGQNVNVSLEGDAGSMFNLMQKQSKIYRNQTGMSAFA